MDRADFHVEETEDRERTDVGAARRPATVLVVEDNEQLQRLIGTLLRADGCMVFEADDGVEALAILRLFEGPVDLLLTDVVLPKLGGLDLAHEARTLRPDIAVLYTSGYADSLEDTSSAGRDREPFLAKPFTPDDLVRKVREAVASRE